ncbi:MAG: DUF523 domain-containing protein [Candidatus Omnitrophica bacterium]|nr:DUF523 domain-containing protein [Candidatus Omnitrophota bacterium]
MQKTISKEKKYIVSACLIGKNCFYDGSSSYKPKIKDLVDSGEAIALCPEELGGLKTPRPPAEIFAGSAKDVLKGKAYVFNKEGKDVTISIIKGSKEFLNIAREYGVKKAILKTRSPCCGRDKIYDGTFTNRLKNGNGVTAALLLRNEIEVITDEEFLHDSAPTTKRSAKLHTLKKTIHGKRSKNKRR